MMSKSIWMSLSLSLYVGLLVTISISPSDSFTSPVAVTRQHSTHLHRPTNRNTDTVIGVGLLQLQMNHDDVYDADGDGNYDKCETGLTLADRRIVLSRMTRASALTAVSTLASYLLPTQDVLADTDMDTTLPSSTLSSSTPITHKVRFDVRISRSDGTFYVRDDPPDTIPNPDDQVFYGHLTFGLFGTLAPNHVSKFLEFVGSSPSSSSSSYGNSALFDDAPRPDYARSIFSTLDRSTGLLKAGVIPGLVVTGKFAGTAALEYRGRILPAPLWIEKPTTASTNDDDGNERRRRALRASSSGGGMLVHKNLDPLPSFGITTRSFGFEPSDGGGYTIFGRVIPDDSSEAFLERVRNLPTYSTDRPGGGSSGGSSRAVEEAASSVYSFQKEFFRGAAKTFGDTRLDNVYEGKILRRVEVTSVSIVDN